MDYMVNVNGIDILITLESDNDNCRDSERYSQRRRLLTYYKRLLGIKGIDPESEKYKTLEYLVNNLTEQNAKTKVDNFEKAQADRLLAYMIKIAQLKLNRESPQDEEQITKEECKKMERMADALIEVLDASCEDIREGQETVEINGNKFVYNKNELNIKEHLIKLYEIGEQAKGNTWTIYCDEEGELVIY